MKLESNFNKTLSQKASHRIKKCMG